MARIFSVPKNFITKTERNSSGNLTVNEFIETMKDHENRLDNVFKGIDTDNDSTIQNRIILKNSFFWHFFTFKNWSTQKNWLSFSRNLENR